MNLTTHTGKIDQATERAVKQRCDHGLALVIDPTENELRELEQMLANCPHCSRWIPGDGPIMAVVVTRENTGNDEFQKFV